MYDILWTIYESRSLFCFANTNQVMRHRLFLKGMTERLLTNFSWNCTAIDKGTHAWCNRIGYTARYYWTANAHEIRFYVGTNPKKCSDSNCELCVVFISTIRHAFSLGAGLYAGFTPDWVISSTHNHKLAASPRCFTDNTWVFRHHNIDHRIEFLSQRSS